MSDPDLAAARGAQAEYELRETDQAFKDVRAGLMEAWATSALGEAEFRDRAYHAIQTLDAVKAALIAVASGKAITQHDDLIRNVLAGRDAV